MLKKINLLCFVVVMSFCSPVQAEESLPDGAKLFKNNCVQCHAADGTVSDFGKKLEPFPARNLRALAPYASHDEIQRIVRHGTHATAMKAMKYKLDALEIEALVDYVRSFDYTANLENGKMRFSQVCVSCHGTDGRAKTGMGAKNLVYSTLTLNEIVHTMRYGRANTLMTAKRHQLSNSDIADVATYVHSLRYAGDIQRGATLYVKKCATCHATPKSIHIMGNVANHRKTLADVSNGMLDLRIRHGRHLRKAGKDIAKLSDDEIQDIIIYLRDQTK
ncbi:MAG: c-type cytochrome [Mariprofundaceae bacterium]|nr:c-type cytochrome [Mariprofundaceae bacterium]